MSNVIAISCWFGDRFNKPKSIATISDLKSTLKYLVKSMIPIPLYSKFNLESVIPNPPKNCEKSLFFTNNPSLKKEIISKGWDYSFLDAPIEKGESIFSSLYAKKVKFLQLPQDTLQKLMKFEYILYMDSRRITDNVERMIAHCDKGVVIRYTPKVKTLWDEVDEAKGQERYTLAMPDTINFINKNLENSYTDNYRVMNTGLILYKVGDEKHKEKIISLSKEVYESCMALRQPECQIIWCLLSQKYDDVITKIDYRSISTRRV